MADNVLVYTPDGPAANKITYDTHDIGSGVQRPRMDSFVPQVTVSTDVTRPGNTTTYTAGNAIADSGPTSGGFTFTSAARQSGGTGIITDALFVTSNTAAAPLQGECWIFETGVTAIADNGSFAMTDAEAKTLVAILPFTFLVGTNNSHVHLQNLNIGFTCVGSANLRYLLRARNAYIPANAEVLTARLKIIQTS